MRARSNRWLALLTILSGAVVAVGLTASGCGGSVDEPGTSNPDTGSDTGSITVVDTAKADTGTVMSDSEMMYDVPGSLFDATVPDVVFEGGKTAAGCYGCALSSCKKEAEECDKDPRCRGLFLCVLTDCGASFTDFGCAAGCAFKFGVMGLSDPVIGKVQALGTCVQNKCTAECPEVPETGGSDAPKTDAPKADAPSEASADAVADGSAFMIFPDKSGDPKAMKSIDPRVLDVLQTLKTTFDGAPVARQDLIKQFSH
jgi:hypothetical protein